MYRYYRIYSQICIAISGRVISLNTGTNVITLVTLAADGTTTITYSVTVNRIKSSNALLSKIQLSPNVAVIRTPGTTNYSASVSYATTSVTVTPTTADPNATVTVNSTTVASGSASASIPLNVGVNTITIVSTAQNGTTSLTYSVAVTRAAGPEANLAQAISVEQTPTVSIENDGIIVHHGVSPNGDGINDFLVIDGIASYPENKLTIINRNGALVFETRGYDNTSKVFDGHASATGEMQVPGTYFYALDYSVNGVPKHKTGFILLKY